MGIVAAVVEQGRQSASVSENVGADLPNQIRQLRSEFINTALQVPKINQALAHNWLSQNSGEVGAKITAVSPYGGSEWLLSKYGNIATSQYKDELGFECRRSAESDDLVILVFDENSASQILGELIPNITFFGGPSDEYQSEQAALEEGRKLLATFRRDFGLIDSQN